MTETPTEETRTVTNDDIVRFFEKYLASYETRGYSTGYIRVTTLEQQQGVEDAQAIITIDAQFDLERMRALVERCSDD